MLLLVSVLHEKLINERLLGVGADKSFDWDHLHKTKKKLVSMRFKRSSDASGSLPLDLEAVRDRVNIDKPKSDGLSLRDRHKSAMKHWFKKDVMSEEEKIAERLSPQSSSRLPALEPLPSSEDSYLAFTCDDEVFFDAPVRERWKEFVDEKTAVVRVRRSEEKSYSFAGEALFADMPDEIKLAH